MLRRRHRATTGDRSGARTLSVVVPVYDVAAYVGACLDSIARQPVRDHEVIVVDDGSPDESVDVVRTRMRRDPRVRLVRQENAGLGAARNAGIREAGGRYLAFVDSDDVLPPDAWGAMLASLEATGSDFAVGRADRDDGQRQWATPLMRRNHQESRFRQQIDAEPLMLADVFAWNKIYRREFWSAADLSFPEGVRYEDQPAITRAFLAADSFDVLTECVYLWSVRRDRSSITQKRHELADLVDRVATKQDSALAVRDHGVTETLRTFYAEVLPVDMWEYFRAVPGCSDDYWSTLVAGTRDLWREETVAFEDTAVPAQQRLMGWLVVRDRRTDLEALLDWIDHHRPLPYAGGQLDHPWCGEPGMPAFPEVGRTG